MSRLCVVSGIFNNRLRGVFMLQFSKGFSLVQRGRGVLFGVAIGLSDPLHETRLLLYGGLGGGDGGSGFVVWFLLGFSQGIEDFIGGYVVFIF